jgi:polysaccharide export outer membrane protein
MKELKRISGCLFAVLGLVGTFLLLTGCHSPPVYADFSMTSTAGVLTTNKPVYQRPTTGKTDDLRVGDVVTINFNSGDQPILPQHQEAIKDDGKITPPYVGSVVAAGKSTGELQAELQQKYNRLYVNMTVTVISKDRYYYVSGEVKSPGPKTYLGETDIIKAISSAGDFTDFANKRKVQLIHSDNKTEVIDVKKAIKDSQYDVPVYPGDKIVVPRSIL